MGANKQGKRDGDTFDMILARRLSRRGFLKYAAAGSAVAFLGACGQQQSQPVAKTEPTVQPPTATTEPTPTESQTNVLTETLSLTPTEELIETPTTDERTIGFEAIQPDDGDQIVVPVGYTSTVLIRWGDPLTKDAPEFDPNNQTAAAQKQQFGYNCDFNGFMPLPIGSDNSDRGLMVSNHEYTNPDLMFAGFDPEKPTQEQVDIQLEAHGLSIIEIERNNGIWSYKRDSASNRRITATTEMELTGPAAGHKWLQTKDDPTGKRVVGTINNCSGGKTPWGTVVSGEENFFQYFANMEKMADDDPRKQSHTRYSIPEKISVLGTELYYDRFDTSKEPNETFRFGWSVEIDPYDPQSVPKKRTALGRFVHEAQTFIVAPDGRVVCYSGDDARFEYSTNSLPKGHLPKATAMQI